MNNQTLFDKEKIRKFCREHYIKKAVLFGSYAAGMQQEGSDIDILVEFEDGRLPGLDFFSMEEDLSRLLGLPVDLNTPGFLAHDIRESVFRNGVLLYVA